MKTKRAKYVATDQKHKGIVLLFTLVLLVLLSALCYNLTTKVRAHRSANQYMIDYQAAKYACDSVVKYIDSNMDQFKFDLIARPNEPDFSDIFSLDDEEYQQLIDIWSQDPCYVDQFLENHTDQNESFDLRELIAMSNKKEHANKLQANDSDANDFLLEDMNEFDTNEYDTDYDEFYDANSDEYDTNEFVIRGPYGYDWPNAIEPMEFNVGNIQVTVELIDENAKFPIGWTLLNDETLIDQATASFQTLCEWMDVNTLEMEDMFVELDLLSEVKQFQLDFENPQKNQSAEDANDTKDPNDVDKDDKDKKEEKNKRSARSRAKDKVKIKKVSASTHQADFARLFRKYVDISVFAKDTQVSYVRPQSVLKYLSLTPVTKVNINTAPRNVLEAAFTFGGNAPEIAEEVIVARRLKPFKDLDELKDTLFQFSDSIEKCEDFITTESDFFTARITAFSGTAKVSSVIIIKRNAKRFERIAIISE